ncbi:hypothetical protein [Propionicimonas sp.]|uniref:hypothetical protein n=1 Tax=Propionicimonas sp. TaxID=1955623 RepID=UPI001856461F|nr:hypothetical protein [Propionicimonas sp.]MBA3019634.1 hypothetical protein [Propionicimonas sp.]MBU4208021.1 hypothetical protein [Actinomycetota bacterium]MCG2805753.1 hypothetical protein [Propionicimonas sp.]
MFDLFNSLAGQTDAAVKGGVTLLAVIFFLINSARGNWALARIIGSAVGAALVVAIVFALPFIAKKVETDIKSAPAIVVTADPASPSTIVHI